MRGPVVVQGHQTFLLALEGQDANKLAQSGFGVKRSRIVHSRGEWNLMFS